MKRPSVAVMCFLLALSAVVSTSNNALTVQAQSASTTSVPKFVRFSGVARDLNGNSTTGVVGITFMLYAEQKGGSPLWLETQNATADATGHYSVLLGSTKPDGLPADLFTSEQARWVGVQVNGQAEQARVLLVSAPYALKAGDAETVGGLPASAFVLANSGAATASSKTAATTKSTAAASGKSAPPPANPAVTGVGTVNYIPLWDTGSDIKNSIMFQKSSEIGLNTTTPAATLDVNGKSDVRDTLTLFPKSTDSTLAVNGTTFKVDSTGKVTFITGQTFPGAGTITGVTTASGSGLSGGGTTGTLTLKIPAAGVTNAMLQNSKVTLNSSTAGGLTVPGAMTLGSTYTIGLKACAANQVLQYSGSVWNCAAVGTGTITGVTTASGSGLAGGGTSGTLNLSIPNAGVTNAMLQHSSVTLTPGSGLTGAGAMTLGNSYSLNIDTTKIPELALANTFSNTQKFTGNPGITVTSTSSDGVDSTSSSGVGVYGNSTSNYGVYGYSTNTTGVDGYSVDFDGGVFEASSSGAYGSRSDTSADVTFNTGVAGWEFGSTQETIGVWGMAGSPLGLGSYSEGYSSSAVGTVCCAGLYSIGSWSDTSGNSGSTAGIASLLTVDTGYSLVAYNNSDFVTAFIENDETSASGDLVFETYGSGFGGFCDIDVSGNLLCSGSVTPVVPVGGGSRKVAMNTISSPESWFEDAGSGELSKGEAVINVESVFGETVNTGVEYHVFLTPGGDCKGLYVAQKSATSFVVRELGGGSSSIAFDYRIMAKRKGYELARMADVTKPLSVHGPAKRPTGSHSANPDQFRKAHMAKAEELSKLTKTASFKK